MKIDDLNELPEWDDDKFRDDEDEEGEEWKPNPTKDLCKAMYEQWNHVKMSTLLMALSFMAGPRRLFLKNIL